MDEEVEHTELMCNVCKDLTEHEIRYAGRLMVEIRCLTCRNDIHVRRDDLSDDYLHDLRQRFSSKPRRIVARLRRHPALFLKSLPAAVLHQPRKFASEVKSIRREARRNRSD